MTDDVLLLGLDIEASAPLEDGGALLAIGVAEAGGRVFYSLIAPRHPFAWNPEAAKVHGITMDEALRAPSMEEVDRRLAEWLTPLAQGKHLVPVGFAVGTFDMPFVRKFLPNSWRHFKFRHVDLGSICHAVAVATGKTVNSVKHEVKGNAAAELEKRGIPREWHNAGYDARAAIGCFGLLSRGIERIVK